MKEDINTETEIKLHPITCDLLRSILDAINDLRKDKMKELSIQEILTVICVAVVEVIFVVGSQSAKKGLEKESVYFLFDNIKKSGIKRIENKFEEKTKH